MPHANHLCAGRVANAFLEAHASVVRGELTMFDRMIFKGHLSGFYHKGAFESMLFRQGVLLKHFGKYVEKITSRVKAHAQKMARDAGRPFEYLQCASTKASGRSKEDIAREIARRDGVTEGLVCVLSVLEPCGSFDVRGNRETRRLEIVRRRRKCLHFYFYFIDPEFGFMHVRLQSWFPFEIQVYINGREWLSRKLDAAKVPYRRRENCLTWIGDMDKARWHCERFFHRRWPGVLTAMARRCNPFLATVKSLGLGGYYWVLDQAEVSTDVIFRDREALERVFPDLIRHATLHFSAQDILRFLGRKLHGAFRGEVTTDHKRRTEGCRVKHRMKRNSIKMYDRGNVLRIETTINNPREFKVLRVIETPQGRSRRWLPMGKGVANLWRYAQVGTNSNGRYLEALAHVRPTSHAIRELDSLAQSHERNTAHIPKLNPFGTREAALFEAVMAGENCINGFRNKDITAHLYPAKASTPLETKRRCVAISRIIAKLRGHRLIAKVQNQRLYHVTPRGYRLMSTILRVRNLDFPDAYISLDKAA